MRGASAPPIPPLLSAPDYCAYKPIFPSQTPQDIGWCESGGGILGPVGSKLSVDVCADRSVGTLLRAPTCAPPDLRFSLRKCGCKTRNLNQPRQLRCHQNAFMFFSHEFVARVPETWSHTRLLFVCRSRETCVDICAQMQCR